MAGLNTLRQLVGLLPEVADRRATPVPFRNKALNTITSVLVFLAGSRLPLYGLSTTASPDPFYWIHAASASNGGTVMAQGVYHLLVSELVIHPLFGLKIVRDKIPMEERMQFMDRSQKLLGILLAMVSAVCNVFSAGQLGPVNATLIALQLSAGGAIVIYLDEALKKGHGLVSSGIALFTATNICACFLETYGGDKIVIPAGTCAFLALTVRLQGLHLPLAVRTHGVDPALQANCSVNLSYLSYMPIVFQGAIASSMYFISQLLYLQYGENNNGVVKLLGSWKRDSRYPGQLIPIGGVAHYVTNPPAWADLARDPVHVTLYAVLLLMACALISATWFGVRVYSRKYVARLLGRQIPVTPAQPGSIPMTRWKRHVAMIALLVGLCVGALTLMAGFICVPGSGTGIMLVVTVVCSYFERRTGDQAADFLVLTTMSRCKKK
ncbi:hypothetical protein CFC21_054059 [Triticum aestivum]|uniref:Translocon Sec61/SecY plug domain-containing protein n=2 Tax=Triticum aestivum TaxID=4565 RepID=A0A9R1K8K5_WHEAT|nr:hypothetical protein CFC21_054059 [Triticum aestivum]